MGNPGVRKVRGFGLAACVLVLGALPVLPAPAAAQDLDIALFRPSGSPNGLLSLETARVLPHWTLYAALNSHYANDELVARRGDTIAFRPINHRAVAEVAVGASFFERLDVSAVMPIVLRQVSDGWPGAGETRAHTGLGDLRLTGRGILLRNKCGGDIGDVGVAGVITGALPTGDDGQLMGDDQGSLTLRAAVDYCHPSGFIVALNAGGVIRRDREIGGFNIGDELLVGVGAEAPLGAYGVSLLGEVEGRFGLETDDKSPEALIERRIPLEARGAVRWRSSWGLMVTAGAGAGLTGGYGAPDYRLFLGIGYALDMSDKPEPAPEPTPQPEKTYPDEPGDVPPKKPDAPLDAAAFDRAAANDPDPDGDGIPSSADRCPKQPEDRDGFEDSDGCPDPDNDHDGVPDADDKCPKQKEVINGIKDDDGCPDEGKAKVAVTATKVEILEKVFFETGSDQLKPASEALLEQVAGVLKAAWQIRRLRVEGHTDSRGDKEMNVDLSERRARRVKVFLESRGVARHRLEARGYGPTKPVASNRTRKGRAKNRRVEFTILERAKAPEGGAK